MTLYIISDPHFNHGNVIEHSDRPFDDTEAMNEALEDAWNTAVSDEDTVICLGDLAVWSTGALLEQAERLNGSLLLVKGNHDAVDPADAPFPVVDSCTFSHDGTSFYCEHRPVTVPDDADWWHLYGHHHNNDLGEFPLFDPDARRLNVSAELLDYTPVPIETLLDIIDRGERRESLNRGRV